MINENTFRADSMTRPISKASESLLLKIQSLQSERQQPAVERQGLRPLSEDRYPENNSELEDVIVSLNDYVQSIQRELQFSIDEESGRSIVKIIDSQSDEVIKQIPSEEIMAIARHLEQSIQGSLVKEMA